jgi:BirA family transcriptional regulator, biotin operon repressor / biotin---[acetyl-CoA-carboxylase] ligase
MNRTDERVIELLRAGDGIVSGERLCAELAMTRAAVWKHVAALRSMGYRIDSCPGSGYRLAASPDIPYPCEVRSFLHTRHLGAAAEFLATTDSTNRQLADRARGGAPHGSLLVADTQTAGRGRMTRQWFSPPGKNLYFSLLLRPDVVPMRAPQLALLAGLALAKAVETLCPALTPKVKWPNDVFLDGAKLSGILCDMAAEADRVHYLIVGVGVNVNIGAGDFPPDLRGRATSLRTVAGRPVSRPRLLAGFLNQFEPVYEDWLVHGLSGWLPELTARSYLNGRELSVDLGRESLRGLAVGLSGNGGLLLDCGDRIPREIVCGDVHIV